MFKNQNFNEENSSESHNKGSKKLTLFLSLLFLISAATAVYFYFQFKEIRENPNKVAESEVANVVEKVGKLMVLPQGEIPTLATVRDTESLKRQPFFANAKIGDHLLLYAGARKAILYDPVTNKIVEVAALTLGQQERSQ